MKISTKDNILSSEQLMLILSGEIERSIEYFMRTLSYIREESEEHHLIFMIEGSDRGMLEDVLRGGCSPHEFDDHSDAGVLICGNSDYVDNDDIVIFDGGNDPNGEKVIIQWISDLYCVSKL